MICIKCKQEAPDAPFCCWCGQNQSRPAKAVRHRGNGEGTAIKRGKTWTAVGKGYSYTVTDPGGSKHLVRKRPTKGGFRTKSEALAAAAAMTAVRSQTAPTLQELWEGWSQNDMQKLSTSKQTAYNIARGRLEPIIARTIDSLTIDDIQTVVAAQAKTYYPARDMKSLLSALYKRAMANQYVTVNLAQFLVLPDLEEKEAEAFTEAEVKKMWEAYASGNQFVGYLLLMIYSGMMPAELMACKVDMINWDTHEIFGCGKKTKKRKEVPIVFADFVAPVLEKMVENAGKSGKLLSMNKDNFYKKYHATLKEIGVRDLDPYSCRHTTATDAVKKNIAPSVIQQLMRHSKITTTQRYIHVGSAETHAAANALSQPNKHK